MILDRHPCSELLSFFCRGIQILLGGFNYILHKIISNEAEVIIQPVRDSLYYEICQGIFILFGLSVSLPQAA